MGFLNSSCSFTRFAIVDPVPTRTISLVVRSDFIHEARLNAVVEAVRHIIPGHLLDSVVRNGKLVL